MTEQEPLRRAAEWLLDAQNAVAFTGAGISTESGIPDFRSPGGVWSKYQPVMFDDFLARAEARHEYWRQKCEAHADFAAAEPNAGHRALARWERRGLLWGVITQNIDGLHQAAGSRNVLELHGTNRAIQCLDCQQRFAPEPMVEAFLETGAVPDCPACGGRLKHATISFGQALAPEVIEEALQRSRRAEVFLAIGSSLVVEPAASLPRLAQASGARLVIVNRDPTGGDDVADLVLNEPIGATLKAIDALLTWRA
ncbi:MAG: SIR2 family NAD-dependent protein deacylase [Planctomycetota bacterium]|jgi:NAD-dependent deacetylase